METVYAGPDFKEWRATARRLLLDKVQPDCVQWIDSSEANQTLLLFEDTPTPEPMKERSAAHVPSAYLKLAEACVLHRDVARWNVLYRVLWRLTHGEPHLLEISSDADVLVLKFYEKSVRRDCHKMTAFVRFKEVKLEQRAHFRAWYQPDHYIVKRTAPFFVERFSTMSWSIHTPDLCAHFVDGELFFTPGETKPATAEDATESLWKTYYANIFNPARVKIKAMKKELPVRFWQNLPEAELIPSLIEKASQRASAMITRQPDAVLTATAFIPENKTLPSLQNAARSCEGCELYKTATQTVFGEGKSSAKLFFIGEQPGDQEDMAGQPFIGPAGQLLDRVLNDVGIDRTEAYVTNAVKHFRFEVRGKRRLHGKPSARHIHACKPWLEAEIAAVKPKLLVCLGGTAAQSIFGPEFRITTERGTIKETRYKIPCVATYHPSVLLRVPDHMKYEKIWAEFLHDLKIVRNYQSP